MVCAKDVQVKELDHVATDDVHRHGRVKVEVLAAALGALEVHDEDERVGLFEPNPELSSLALVVPEGANE